MKSQAVILSIKYDEAKDAPPSQWNWPVLLDISPDHVDVVLTGVLLSAEET